MQAPTAPQTRCTGIIGYPRDRIAATKVRAITARAERPPTAIAGHLPQEKGLNTNVQIKTPTELVKSLGKTVEGQNQTHQNWIEALTMAHHCQFKALTKTHHNQIEALTETRSQPVDRLKLAMGVLLETMEQTHSQLIQFSSN